MLGSEIKLHLTPDYKNYFERIIANFRELTHTIVPLIAGGVPSMKISKLFLEDVLKS